MADATLRVSEVFFSLQGETSRTGLPTLFVRLTGCPLRCGYCDTTYAFQGGETWILDDLLTRVATFPVRRVCVTGGEPLAQKACLPFLTRLCDAGYEVSLETSGALDVRGVDSRVVRVVDVKTPGSGEAERNFWSNLGALTPHDEVKFVLTGPEDYAWACAILREYGLSGRCPVLFSAASGSLEPAQLAGWILRDGLDVRLQVQLHKLLWGEVRGR